MLPKHLQKKNFKLLKVKKFRKRRGKSCAEIARKQEKKAYWERHDRITQKMISKFFKEKEMTNAVKISE